MAESSCVWCYREREAGKYAHLPSSQVLDLREFAVPEAMLVANTVHIILFLHTRTYYSLIYRLDTAGDLQQQ